ncbi:MAG TPA: Uma2 family endonuclease [Terriglobales bacterium]|nr:Uma2 family endonuclease [Terriglobales bacterium]
MGNIATPELLIARWNEMCRDPSLQDLPYKIELNAWGKVEMGPPAGVGHGRQQTEVAMQLQQQLKDGVVITECPVLTDIGVRVPDVVWASNAFRMQHKHSSPLPRAPEICVEIYSPSNVDAEIAEKTRAYREAGAHEVWIVAQNGSIRYIDPSGEMPRSRFPVAVSAPDVTTDYL